MGNTCNSGVGHSLEKSCSGQLRRRKRTNSSSTTTSSSSNSGSSNDLSNNNNSKNSKNSNSGRAQKQIGEGGTLMKTNEVMNNDGGQNRNETLRQQIKVDVRDKQQQDCNNKPSSLEPKEGKEEGEEATNLGFDSSENEQTIEERKRRLEKLKEGVDFIETEEDAEAVESAVVKIQSTFRGKKIRSKLNQPKTTTTPATGSADNQTGDNNSSSKEVSSKVAEADSSSSKKADEELNKKVATMQVNDNSSASAASAAAGTVSNAMNLPEEEAERAATKIQAGFKGYKTRKELEGKLSGQQAAPTAAGAQADSTNAAAAAAKAPGD